MPQHKYSTTLGAILVVAAVSLFMFVRPGATSPRTAADTISGTVIQAPAPAPTPAPASVVQPAPSKEAHFIEVTDIVPSLHLPPLYLRSGVALVLDDRDNVMLYGRNVDERRPIASLTKLMTTMVVLDAHLPLSQPIEITRADRDTFKDTGSRIPFGTVLTRYDLLHAALAASDNRAAAALARTYPGGLPAFVAAMNRKAQALGMLNTHYVDSTGLHSEDVSTARDLTKLIAATDRYPLYRRFTTTGRFTVWDLRHHRRIAFLNTDRLVRRGTWDIRLSKTGYTSEAGNCLVLQTRIHGRELTIVLLNSWGKLTRFADAIRVRNWVLHAGHRLSSPLQMLARSQG